MFCKPHHCVNFPLCDAWRNGREKQTQGEKRNDEEGKWRCKVEVARFKRDARSRMRRWRPLSSSRSRNVISSPQATRVAFVSPFRIPSSCEGGRGRGTGIKLQWKSTHSALYHRRPLLFSSSYCQRREKRVNKILLCNVLLVSRFCFAVLSSTSLSFSRLSRYRLILRYP